MYFLSFLSDNQSAAINPSGPISSPAKNYKVPSWPLSEARVEARNPKKTPRRRTTKKAMSF